MCMGERERERERDGERERMCVCVCHLIPTSARKLFSDGEY